jgi:hypothetical protein
MSPPVQPSVAHPPPHEIPQVSSAQVSHAVTSHESPQVNPPLQVAAHTVAMQVPSGHETWQVAL